MAEDWNAIAAEVDAALKSVGSTDAGFSGTLVQTALVGGDPWNPGSGTLTEVSTAVTIVVTEYAKTDIDGTLILASDRKVLMTAVAGVVPHPADVLIISGTSYSVVNAMPLAPAGVTVMHEIQARA
jgi:hypothetical protein